MKEITNWKSATVMDMEADGLLEEATLFHVLHFHMADGKNGKIDGADHERLKRFFYYHIKNKLPVVVHRGILFDIPLFEKLLEIDLSELMVIDTLAVSWYLNVKRKIHGLDSFLEDYGIPKPKVGEAEWVSPIRGVEASMKTFGKGADKEKKVVFKYIVEPEEVDEDYKKFGVLKEDINVFYANSVETKERYLERVKAHKDLMYYRCEEDVKINLALWQDFMRRLHEMYSISKLCIDEGKVNPKRMSKDEVTYLDQYVNNSSVEDYIDRCLTFLMFKMDCARLQEKTRWKVDTEYLQESFKTLGDKVSETLETLESVMPSVPKYAPRKMPTGDWYKKDKTLKASAVKWNEHLSQVGLKDHLGNDLVILTDKEDQIKVLVGYEKPNANSSDQLKSFFFSHGWVPDVFEYVKDKDAQERWVKNGFRKEDKPVPRKIPQINKVGDEGKELCDSLVKLSEEVPEIMAYNGYSVAKDRYDTIKGFIRNMKDGHLQARIGGYTNTLRVKHRELVNLVGVDKPYGENIRGVLICEDDEILLGSDLSSLEDRTKHHFMLPHDPSYVETMMADDYDPHILTAHAAGMISDKELSDFKNGVKEEHVVKARKSGKSTNYACLPVSESLVLTYEGYKDIYSLNIGDEVIGNIGGQDVSTKITDIQTLLLTDVYCVSFKEGVSLYCTKEHSWLTDKDNTFKHTDDLVIGDKIYTGKGYITFEGVKFSHKSDVFCLSTDTNTFYVKQYGFKVLTGNCVYGGSPEAISRSAGVDLATAKKLHEGYWKLNWSVKAIAEEQCVFEDSRKQKWLINPINGICYSLRTEKDRFSTLAQGSGSFFFDMWVDRILDQMMKTFKTKKLTGSFHKLLWLQ